MEQHLTFWWPRRPPLTTTLMADLCGRDALRSADPAAAEQPREEHPTYRCRDRLAHQQPITRRPRRRSRPDFVATMGYRPAVESGMLREPERRLLLPGHTAHGVRDRLQGPRSRLRPAALCGPRWGTRCPARHDGRSTRSSARPCTPPARRAAASTAEGLRCRAWADVATAAVWVNSWRQGSALPGRACRGHHRRGWRGPRVRRCRRSAAGGLGCAPLDAGSAARPSSHAGRGAPRRAAARLAEATPRRLDDDRRRRRGIRIGLSRASCLAAPSSKGLAVALFLLPTLAVLRRLRPDTARFGPRARVLVAVAGAGLLAGGAVWADAQQDAQRAAAGLAPSGLRYWLVAMAVAGAALLLTRAARWVVRNHRRRVWRPAVALGAMAALLAPAAPAQATAPTPGGDHVLAAASPVGAVRAYAAERPGRVAARTRRAGRRRPGRPGRAVQGPRGADASPPVRAGWTRLRWTASSGASTATSRSSACSTPTPPAGVAYLFQRAAAEAGARELERAVSARIDSAPGRAADLQLHLYGESLGALAGQAVLADPARADGICSALWVGVAGRRDGRARTGGQRGQPQRPGGARDPCAVVAADDIEWAVAAGGELRAGVVRLRRGVVRAGGPRASVRGRPGRAPPHPPRGAVR